MSVRMALAKLCACACGGALAGGGFVHVVERSQPRPANPVLVKARQPVRVAHRVRRPLPACAPGPVRTAMRADPIRYATAPSISGYQMPDAPGGYGGDQGNGYGGAPVLAGGRANGGYGGGGFFGGFFGSGGGTTLALAPTGGVTTGSGTTGSGTTASDTTGASGGTTTIGAGGTAGSPTSGGGTSGSGTSGSGTSGGGASGGGNAGKATTNDTISTANISSTGGTTASTTGGATSGGTTSDGGTRGGGTAADHGPDGTGGNAAEPVPAPPMILLFGAAVGALVLRRRLARKPA